MHSKTLNVRKLVQMALLIALLAVLDVTGVGLIRIPPLPAITVLHIPVILGGILLGPACGGILGGAFGLISMLEATFRPGSPTDMLFSPFTTDNVIATLVMCYLPRILLGVLAGFLFRWISKVDKTKFAAIGVAAGVATIFHSATVLSCLWLFFDQLALKEIFASLIAVNGLLEIGLAVVLSILICKPLLKYFERQSVPKA